MYSTRWNQVHQRPPNLTWFSRTSFKPRDRRRSTASTTPRESAWSLYQTVSTYRSSPPSISFSLQNAGDRASVFASVSSLLCLLREWTPLVHHITYDVAMNQSANITRRRRQSVDDHGTEEMEDVSKICSALLVNLGTVADTRGTFKSGCWKVQCRPTCRIGVCVNLNRKPSECSGI